MHPSPMTMPVAQDAVGVGADAPSSRRNRCRHKKSSSANTNAAASAVPIPAPSPAPPTPMQRLLDTSHEVFTGSALASSFRPTPSSASLQSLMALYVMIVWLLSLFCFRLEKRIEEQSRKSKGSSISEEVVCDNTSDALVLKLFGKTVVLNESHHLPSHGGEDTELVKEEQGWRRWWRSGTSRCPSSRALTSPPSSSPLSSAPSRSSCRTTCT